MTCYSTFPPGLGPLVAAALERELDDARVISLLEGGILYATTASRERVADLRFFSNSFHVLEMFPGLEDRDPLAAMARRVAAGRTGELRPQPGRGTFRVVASSQNRLARLPADVREALERRIAALTRSRIARAGARHEYWLLTRSEGLGLFLLRFTRRRGTHAKLHPGELHPEIAHCLCLMSNPTAGDVFLDPFCGWGSIVAERARSFPFRRLHACDLDPTKVEALRARLGTTSTPGLEVRRADATRLEHLEDRSIDAVVTDPPWGAYEKLDVADLYHRVLARVARLLKPTGVVVLLVERTAVCWDAIAASPFDVAERYDILVSGRKASAVCLRPRPAS